MSALKLFTVERTGSVLVITPMGNMMSLDEHRLAAELETIRSQMLQPGVTNLVIDFGKVPYFGSIMLGAIQMLARHLQARQGKLALCSLSTMARDVLQVTHFDKLWPIYVSQKEACDSFDEHQ